MVDSPKCCSDARSECEDRHPPGLDFPAVRHPQPGQRAWWAESSPIDRRVWWIRRSAAAMRDRNAKIGIRGDWIFLQFAIRNQDNGHGGRSHRQLIGAYGGFAEVLQRCEIGMRRSASAGIGFSCSSPSATRTTGMVGGVIAN